MKLEIFNEIKTKQLVAKNIPPIINKLLENNDITWELKCDEVTGSNYNNNKLDNLKTNHAQINNAKIQNQISSNIQTEILKTGSILGLKYLELEFLKTKKLESEILKTKNLESEILNTKNLETENLQAKKIESNNIITKNLESDIFKTKNLETENLNTKKLESENVQTKNLETNILKTKNTQIENLNILKTINLKIYPSTRNIILVEPSKAQTNDYYIVDNKLYQYISDTIPRNPVNGNYLMCMSFDSKYQNKAYNSFNGKLTQLFDYFDSSGSNLFINSIEYKENGTIIITDDFKLGIRIENRWIVK
jgi:hypothetical protein